MQITPETEGVFLDLDNVMMYGFERRKSVEVVDAIIRGIEAATVATPVMAVVVTLVRFELNSLSF